MNSPIPPPISCAESSDRGLAALALVEASNDGSAVNVRSILSTTASVDLIAGMVTLVTSLTVSLAAATGVGPDIITDHLRSLLFEHAEMEQS